MKTNIKWTPEEKGILFKELAELRANKYNGSQVDALELAQRRLDDLRQKDKIWSGEACEFFKKFKVWSAQQRLNNQHSASSIQHPASPRAKRKYPKRAARFFPSATNAGVQRLGNRQSAGWPIPTLQRAKDLITEILALNQELSSLCS